MTAISNSEAALELERSRDGAACNSARLLSSDRNTAGANAMVRIGSVVGLLQSDATQRVSVREALVLAATSVEHRYLLRDLATGEECIETVDPVVQMVGASAYANMLNMQSSNTQETTVELG